MSLEMFEKAVAKIPALVEKMASYYSGIEDADDWVETVCEYFPSGTEISKNIFEIGPYTVKQHLAKAIRIGLDVSGDVEQGFTVKRTLSDGCYYIVTYKIKVA